MNAVKVRRPRHGVLAALVKRPQPFTLNPKVQRSITGPRIRGRNNALLGDASYVPDTANI